MSILLLTITFALYVSDSKYAQHRSHYMSIERITALVCAHTVTSVRTRAISNRETQIPTILGLAVHHVHDLVPDPTRPFKV